MNGLPPLAYVAAFLAGALAGAPLMRLGLALAKRYPVVAPLSRAARLILMGAAGAGCALIVGHAGAAGAEPAAALALLAVLVMLAASDLQYRILPDRLIVPCFVLFGAFRLFVHPLPLWQYALGFFAGGGVPYLVSLAAVRAGRPPMGGGDIKLMALVGLALGAELALLTLLAASAIGLLAGGTLLLFRQIDRHRFLPFAPAVLPAAVLTWLYGSDLLERFL